MALIRSRRFLWHQHLHGDVIHYTSACKQTGENESLCVESEDALSVILVGLGERLQVARMPLNFSLFSSGLNILSEKIFKKLPQDNNKQLQFTVMKERFEEKV